MKSLVLAATIVLASLTATATPTPTADEQQKGVALTADEVADWASGAWDGMPACQCPRLGVVRSEMNLVWKFCPTTRVVTACETEDAVQEFLKRADACLSYWERTVRQGSGC